MIFIFEVHVKAGVNPEQYAQAWIRASEIIQQSSGALGTKLHQKIGEPQVLLAIATWQSKQQRDSMESHLSEQAREIISQQAEFVEVKIIGEFEEPLWQVMPASLH